MQKAKAIHTPGVGAWLLQRLSAFLLFFFLGLHLWLTHFFPVGERVTYERVVERLSSPAVFAVDIALLTTAIFHSLNGIRMIITEFGASRREQVALLWLFLALGFLALGYGIYGLLPFIR